MLSLLLAVVVFVVLVMVLVPLLRGALMAPDPRRFDQAVYRDQLAELERDVARGVLSESEAAGARLEIQRRLLAAAAKPEGRAARLGSSPVMAGLVALVIVGGSLGLYFELGDPALPDMPIAARRVAANPAPDANHVALPEAAARLAERLKADPANAEGWLLYARTTAMMDQWDKAADAYKRAIDLGQKGPDIYASYGEMLVLLAQGIVTPAAHAALTSALADDPKNDVARYYLALAAGQAGDSAKAIEMLQSLLADLPQDSPMRVEIGRRIGEAAKAAGLPTPALAQGTPATAEPGPDAATMAAAANMPEDQRKQMISAMVARLAARLETAPNDLNGWLRLGRAFMVLGEGGKAADAFDRAATLKPDDISIPLQGAQALLTGLPPSEKLPKRALALLRKVEVLSPDQPEVLWYFGLEAARDAKPDAARGYWQRLLAQLPADGEDAKMVKAAMDALKGG